MARLKVEYGIDLGTTNSGIARIESGIAIMLEIDNSRYNYFPVNQNSSDIDTFNQNKMQSNIQQVAQYNLARKF